MATLCPTLMSTFLNVTCIPLNLMLMLCTLPMNKIIEFHHLLKLYIRNSLNHEEKFQEKLEKLEPNLQFRPPCQIYRSKRWKKNSSACMMMMIMMRSILHMHAPSRKIEAGVRIRANEQTDNAVLGIRCLITFFDGESVGGP